MLSLANSSLEHLSLASNGIGDQGAAELARALKKNTNLVSLSLANNRIGDKGATELAEALTYNPTITTLDLSGNLVMDPGARAIADALRYNTVLSEVRLDDLAAAYALSGTGNKARESRRLSRKVRLAHVAAIEQGKTIEDQTLTLQIKPATAAAIYQQLTVNQNPLSPAAREKGKNARALHPCAGQTARQLCHSRGFPVEQVHPAVVHTRPGENRDAGCVCAGCTLGHTGSWCEQEDACLGETSRTFCGGHGEPVVDDGDCRCFPCAQLQEGEHGYHGDRCEKRACNSSDIFSKGGAKIPLDCTELNLQSSGMRPTECAALVGALAAQANRVTRISLQNTFIGKAGATALARYISTNNIVKMVELQSTPIYNKGASALLEALKVNTVVTGVTLSRNSVDDEGVILEINAELDKNRDENLLKKKKKTLSRLKAVCNGKSALELCHGKGQLSPVFDKDGPFCGCKDCDEGYSGTLCHIFTPCYRDVTTGKDWCYGHGTPEVSGDGTKCTCSNCDGGFTGARCEKHDPCHSKTRKTFCNNHGAVRIVESPFTGSLRCECHECDWGYTGPHCDVFDACIGKTKANLCFNRGTPTEHTENADGNTVPTCVCTACTHGYTGHWCSTAPLCRRGTVSLGGSCVEDCPTGMFANKERTCEPWPMPLVEMYRPSAMLKF